MHFQMKNGYRAAFRLRCRVRADAPERAVERPWYRRPLGDRPASARRESLMAATRVDGTPRRPTLTRANSVMLRQGTRRPSRAREWSCQFAGIVSSWVERHDARWVCDSIFADVPGSQAPLAE
jgi:hypothetical protein